MIHLTGLIDSDDRHVQILLPIVCGYDQMLEPDFAVVRGSDADYLDRLPSAADALCVVEVADSSLERDRDEKLPIYARAGVRQYVILNLRSRTAEVYEQPTPSAGTYPPPKVVPIGGAIALDIGADQPLIVDLSNVLPPAVDR